MPRLHGETATAYMAAVLSHVEDLRRGVDAIRAAQSFVRFEIEKTPDESEHVYTYAGGYSALTAIADTVAREALAVGEMAEEFLKASPDLGALMKADAAAPAQANCSQMAA